MKLVFATNNKNKLEEVRRLAGSHVEILSLEDIGCREELPETHDTIEENACEKASYISGKYHIDCFAEDTGLEIDALNGEPGVYSARYAGEQKDARENVRLVLKKMQGTGNRSARFKTVICMNINGQEKLFTGIIEGKITGKEQGTGGFGYDPIFRPGGSITTFAEMSMEEKNKISHRAVALRKLIAYLKSTIVE